MFDRKRLKNKLSIACLAVLVVFGVGILLFSSHAHAADTTINATICDDQPPLLTINSPISDSTVSTNTVELSGTSLRTTQINITQNGTPSQSVAIGNDASFSTQLSLTQGTNTIELDTYFSCNQTHTTTTLVVTYEPTVQPGLPPSTSVQQPGLVTISGGRVSNPSGVVVQSGNGTAQQPPAPGITERIKDNLGFGGGTTIEKSWVTPVYTWLSALITFGALLIVLLPTQMIQFIASTFKGSKTSSRILRISTRLLRVVAAIVGIVFGLIVQL